MNLSPCPFLKFFDNNGNPLVNGQVFTYLAGSTTKTATYTDSTGSTLNSNPVVLNARGEAAIWLDPTVTYKYVLSPANDTDPPTNPIRTTDNISGATGTATVFGTTIADVFTGNGSQTTFAISQNPGNVANLDVSVDGATLVPNLDYTWISGTNVTFTVAPSNGQKILIRYIQGLPTGISQSTPYYIQTNSEIIAGVTPVNHAYPEGYVIRYGNNSTPGTTDMTSAILSAVAVNKSGGNEVVFSCGAYAYSTQITINYSNAVVIFLGKVTLKYTGANSQAVSVDGGISGGIYNVNFGWGNPPTIQAQGTTYAIYLRAAHHCRVDIACTAAVTAALQTNFSVCSKFRVAASSNVQAFVQQPASGVIINPRNVGESTTDCDFDVIIEGVSSTGIVCNDAENCTFRGTSEGNGGGGYAESSPSRGNTLINLFCEANTLADFTLAGLNTLLLQNNSGSSAVSAEVSGARNVIQGGLFRKLQIDSGAYGTVMRDVGILDVPSGGSLTDSSVTTVYQNVRRETANGTNSVPDTARSAKIKVVGTMAVTAATNAAKCLVTVTGAGGCLDYGDSITFASVGGMTNLNGNTYQVEPIADTDQFYLLSGGAYVNSTGFGAYTSGGTATYVGFSNSWAAAGGSYRAPAFTKYLNKRVHLMGSIASGTLNATAFTLPAGFRPAGLLSFAAVNASGVSTSYVSISAAGAVTVISAVNNTNCSLDGISFVAEQ